MEQNEVWNAIAGKWAKFRTNPTKEIVEFLDDKSGIVLDLGCGSGRHFFESDDLKFYGMDFSEKLLKIAGEKGYVELKNGDVGDIPYSDGFFDLIIFVRVLHCVEDEKKRVESLREVYRVLKSGGEAVISTWGKGHSRTKNKGKEFYVPWSVGSEKVERYTYIYDRDELERQLKEIGFEIVSLEEGENVVAIVKKVK